jgi:O-6-methylguanine DNA methyltransferase
MAESLIETPIGPLFIVTTARGVRLLSFVEGTHHDGHMTALERDRNGASAGAADEVLEEATRQLDEYFDGLRRSFDIPLDLTGTEFQRRVWQSIAAIPFGETASYSEVAASAGAPNAYRAAGTACGANPVVIFVPCHRVIGTDRGLHGFGGGLNTKVWLLRHEGSISGIKAERWANAPTLRQQPVLAL